MVCKYLKSPGSFSKFLNIYMNALLFCADLGRNQHCLFSNKCIKFCISSRAKLKPWPHWENPQLKQPFMHWFGSFRGKPQNLDLPLHFLWVIPSLWPYQSHSRCPSCNDSDLGSISLSVVHLCNFKWPAVGITGDTQRWVNFCQKTNHSGMEALEIMEYICISICIMNDKRVKFHFLAKTESFHWAGRGTEQRKLVQREGAPYPVHSIIPDLHLWSTGLEDTLFCTFKFKPVILTKVICNCFHKFPEHHHQNSWVSCTSTTEDGKTACHCLDKYELTLISRYSYLLTLNTSLLLCHYHSHLS